MAPTRPRGNADDSHGSGSHGKGDNSHGKEKSGSHANGHTTNGKSRRSAASANAAANAAAAAAAAAAAQQQQQLANGTGANGTTPNPTIQWAEFGRGVLHAYRRTYDIEAPGAYSNELLRFILTQPGSVGRYSPTMMRRRELRRQGKDQLANTMRKHSNSLSVQENDVIVDFLHKVRNHDVGRLHRPRRMGSNARELDG